MGKEKVDTRGGMKMGWPQHFNYARKENVENSRMHPGFKAVQNKIAREEGVSEDRAGAILASASRGASPAAKKKNPRLKKVKGY